MPCKLLDWIESFVAILNRTIKKIMLNFIILINCKT